MSQPEYLAWVNETLKRSRKESFLWTTVDYGSVEYQSWLMFFETEFRYVPHMFERLKNDQSKLFTVPTQFPPRSGVQKPTAVYTFGGAPAVE